MHVEEEEEEEIIFEGSSPHPGAGSHSDANGLQKKPLNIRVIIYYTTVVFIQVTVNRHRCQMIK